MVRERNVDVVCIGSGIGGLSAAITAAEAGLEAVVVEKSSKVGGVTAYSYGELWIAPNDHEKERGIDDSIAKAQKYMEFLAAGFADERLRTVYLERGSEALNFFRDKIGLRTKIIAGFADYYYPYAEGSVGEGRFLEVEPFPGKELGAWADKTRLSPLTPYGMLHDDMFGAGGVGAMQHWDFGLMQRRLENDERCLGAGLAAYFVKGALDYGVELWTDSPAVGLDVDGGRITGVQVASPEGELLLKARRGVVIAAGAYDWNETFNRFYEHWDDLRTMVFPAVEGDNLLLGASVGAVTAAVPSFATPAQLGFHLPGEEHEGKPLWRAALTECGLPHAILVDKSGKRFADESFYRDVITKVHWFDGYHQHFAHWPVWLIMDQNHRDKYPFGSVLPGAEFPSGFAQSAGTLEELALKTGIDPDGLTETVQRFNRFCETGQDEDFQRGRYPWSHKMCGDTNMSPNPNLGPIERAPYYAVKVSSVTNAGIGAAGLRINESAQVVNVRGEPIPGLYAAGNSVAYLDMGSGYQSGMANGRGMLQGYLAGRHCSA